MIGCRFVLSLAALLIAASALPAAATTFEVTPLTAKFDDQTRVAVFTIANKESSPAIIQVTAFRWTQSEGKDRLQKTDDLVAVPAVFFLQGGAIQTIRVGLNGNVDRRKELSYRLLLHQVPNKTFLASRHGLNMVMSLSLPLFVEPNVPVASSLSWTLRKIDARRAVLSVSNTGTEHAVLYGLRVTSNNEPVDIEPRLTTILPGSTVTAIVSSHAPFKHVEVEETLGSATGPTRRIAVGSP